MVVPPYIGAAGQPAPPLACFSGLLSPSLSDMGMHLEFAGGKTIPSKGTRNPSRRRSQVALSIGEWCMCVQHLTRTSNAIFPKTLRVAC